MGTETKPLSIDSPRLPISVSQETPDGLTSTVAGLTSTVAAAALPVLADRDDLIFYDCNDTEIPAARPAPLVLSAIAPPRGIGRLTLGAASVLPSPSAISSTTGPTKRYTNIVEWNDGMGKSYKYRITQDLPEGSDNLWKDYVKNYAAVLEKITKQNHPTIKAGVRSLDLIPVEGSGIRATVSSDASAATGSSTPVSTNILIDDESTREFSEALRSHKAIDQMIGAPIPTDAAKPAAPYKSNLCYMHALFHLFTHCPGIKEKLPQDWAWFLDFAQKYKGQQQDAAEVAEAMCNAVQNMRAPSILRFRVPAEATSIQDIAAVHEEMDANAPETLMVHLDRAPLDGTKNQTPVALSENLMLQGVPFELQGYAVHVGTSQTSGHYVCYFKTVDDQGKTHYFFGDDYKIAEIADTADKTAARQFLENANQPSRSGNANFILYTRQSANGD